MEGMMMHRPLLVSNILEYGMNAHRKAGITSVRTEGDIHSYTYPEAGARIAQLAHGLRRRGVQIGDRVATLAWNGYRHFELYYAVGGIGSICHTINPRLSAEQLIYIVNHAEDKLLFLDTTFVPVIAAVAEHLPDDLTFVIMTDRAHMPDTPSTRSATRSCWRARRRRSPGPNWTRTPPAGCAIPPARRAIRRARSIPTAPPCCMP